MHKGEGHNLACVFVFPAFGGKGYGELLAQISVALSAAEGRAAGPLPPITPDALKIFTRLWFRLVLKALLVCCFLALSHAGQA